MELHSHNSPNTPSSEIAICQKCGLGNLSVKILIPETPDTKAVGPNIVVVRENVRAIPVNAATGGKSWWRRRRKPPETRNTLRVQVTTVSTIGNATIPSERRHQCRIGLSDTITESYPDSIIRFLISRDMISWRAWSLHECLVGWRYCLVGTHCCCGFSSPSIIILSIEPVIRR